MQRDNEGKEIPQKHKEKHLAAAYRGDKCYLIGGIYPEYQGLS